jgi:hypothetical protein
MEFEVYADGTFNFYQWITMTLKLTNASVCISKIQISEGEKVEKENPTEVWLKSWKKKIYCDVD